MADGRPWRLTGVGEGYSAQNKVGPRDALEAFGSNPFEFLADALIRDESGDTPFTMAVLGVMLAVFAIEVVLTLRFGAEKILFLVYFFFKNLTWITWPIAPFIHRGVGHFAANVLFIYIAAPVEHRLSKRRYLGLLFLAGFLPVYADGLKLLLFGSEPNVAVMGTSGFGFGLLGYGLATNLGTDWRLTPRWWLIVTIGVAAVLEVVRNGVLSIGDPLSLNIGHLGGLLVGLGLGYLGRSRSSPTGDGA